MRQKEAGDLVRERNNMLTSAAAATCAFNVLRARRYENAHVPPQRDDYVYPPPPTIMRSRVFEFRLPLK